MKGIESIFSHYVSSMIMRKQALTSVSSGNAQIGRFELKGTLRSAKTVLLHKNPVYYQFCRTSTRI